MLNPKILLIVGASTLAMGFATGWTARGWKADSELLAMQNEALEDKAKAEQVAFEAGSSYEAARAGLDATSYETRTIIEREYRNVEIPAECVVPDAVADSLRRSVDAANGNAPSEPESPMP